MRLKVGSKNEGLQGVLLSHDLVPGQLQDYHDLVPGKSDLQPTSKEHVYHVGFYTIPYIRVHIQSWHIANIRK